MIMKPSPNMETNAMNLIAKIHERLAGRYEVREYPSLKAQEARFRMANQFDGKVILDCTPVFWNTLLKYVPLIAGGAKLVVSVSQKVPYDSEVVDFIESIGIQVLWESSSAQDQFDVILDCDGSRAELMPRVGVCELTRSGIYHYAKHPFPVVLIDDSRIKEIETSLGTGDGFMRAMARFGYGDWVGRKVVIFGFGKVGRGVAYRCIKESALVTVIDRTDINLPSGLFPTVNLVDWQSVEAVRAVVSSADVLVTATGVRGVMCRYGLKDIIEARKELKVAAIGIEDEWTGDLDTTRIVNNGIAVNFSLDEPTLLRYIDPSMALSNESAADLLSGAFTSTGINRPLPAAERLCLDPVVTCGLISDEIASFLV